MGKYNLRSTTKHDILQSEQSADTKNLLKSRAEEQVKERYIKEKTTQSSFYKTS